MADHDQGYKRLFSHPELVRDLLQGFIHEPWVGQLDFATLERYPGHFVSEDLRERRNDVIWRVRWGKDWLYLYVILEFQSTVDAYMSVRVATYVLLLYQDLIDNKQVERGKRLPPVLPLVLYNGDRRWTAVRELNDLIQAVPVGLEAYQPRLRYWVIDERRCQQADLALSGNLAAALFRLEASRELEDVQAVLTALVEWLRTPEQESLRRSFVAWLRQVFLVRRLPGVQLPQVHELEEIRAMLADRVVEWTEQWKQKGLREGLQEGLQKGLQKGLQEGLQKGLQKGLQEGLQAERRLLLRQVRRRFGEAVAEQSLSLLARIERPEQFEDLGEALLDCPDGAAWLTELGAAAQ